MRHDVVSDGRSCRDGALLTQGTPWLLTQLVGSAALPVDVVIPSRPCDAAPAIGLAGGEWAQDRVLTCTWAVPGKNYPDLAPVRVLMPAERRRSAREVDAENAQKPRKNSAL
jgi:hypothetical protein